MEEKYIRGDFMDNAALFKLGYGLYVLTVNHDGVDNGCIVNTVMQVTNTPSNIAVVAVNKQNHTHDMIMKSKKLNVSVLTVDTPFELIKHFGFQSGSTVNKFTDCTETSRSENGILYLTKYTNAYLSFHVTDVIDFGSHSMFKVDLVGGELADNTYGKSESLTYAYYQQFIKPKPQATPSEGYRCNICGYIHESDVLPADFICPLCKHGAESFVKQ
jgi:flavin reductase (DIM6/NTAB) family NADH-FMN oxidoreductase RutF/rubredoxin